MKDYKYSLEIIEQEVNNKFICSEIKYAFEASIEALEKQIPMQAFYEYDNEFICPACGHEDDGYEVTTIKVCPECGQKLKWS